jgi:Concanavalin A-like lectin/glucanases superfamily
MAAKRLTRAGAIAAGLLAALLPAPAASAATVSLWHMDEASGTTMVDSVGANSGRLRKVSLGQPGFLRTGYRFAGVGSIVTVPSSASLNPGAAAFSATVHVRTSTVTADDSDDLIRKGLSTNSKTFWKMELRPNSTHTSARVRCYFRGSTATASLYASRIVTDGAWHTIQCFKDAGRIGVVLDGTTRTKAATVGSITNGAALTIGAKSTTDDAYTGLLDEVRFDR